MSSPLKIELIMNFKIDRNIAGCCLKLRMPMTPNVLQNALETKLCLRLTSARTTLPRTADGE
jgi:hypothetical protein